MTIFVFLLPAVVMFLLFLVFPVLQAGYFSLFDWNGFGTPTDWVGLDNFRSILADTVFARAVGNGLLIAGLSLVVQLPLSLGIAIMVGRDLPGRVFFRTMFFLPYVLSEVMTALIWLVLLNPSPDRGFVNALMTLLPGVKAIPWLGSPDTVMFAIFIVLTWKYFGFHMLLYMAGLQNIPVEVEEASRIDGADERQRLWFVTIPMLRSTIRTTVYISVLGSLQQFVLVWIMTLGGPAHASETMATYLYRFGFTRFYLGYGSAVALVMFLMCLAFSLVYQGLFKPDTYV
ncbi:MAG: sugar ABC transporter permease [Chloroflexi bacterium]|nr:sugar ABC transporter permease [Chloroflexota bacterium]